LRSTLEGNSAGASAETFHIDQEEIVSYLVQEGFGLLDLVRNFVNHSDDLSAVLVSNLLSETMLVFEKCHKVLVFEQTQRVPDLLAQDLGNADGVPVAHLVLAFFIFSPIQKCKDIIRMGTGTSRLRVASLYREHGHRASGNEQNVGSPILRMSSWSHLEWACSFTKIRVEGMRERQRNCNQLTSVTSQKLTPPNYYAFGHSPARCSPDVS
jgi:hypothetical protein